MKTWVVYHLIHVRTPHQYLPQLVISGVPDDKKITREMLERAGYQFGEFGIPWANHCIECISQTTPSDLIYRLRQGAGERLTWEKLLSRIEAPL